MTAIHIPLERLTGSVPAPAHQDAMDGRTFYIETFGCQMNDHDSEKVAGVLLRRGYRQVATPEEACVVFYNTCSIREKAAQKVFSRLGLFNPAMGSRIRPVRSSAFWDVSRSKRELRSSSALRG